jgi:hypothetical protein
MLAKINLKTACGCERSYFEKTDKVPPEIAVSIMATDIAFRGHMTPSEAASKRTFRLMKLDTRSSRRIELWYEEVVYG